MQEANTNEKLLKPEKKQLLSELEAKMADAQKGVEALWGKHAVLRLLRKVEH